MNKQFKASEVRGQIAWLRNVTVVGTKTTYQMLDAFADLLEAQERAVPVAYADAATREEILNVAMRKGGYGCEVPLFVHPASSDADRLAEALRKIVEWQPPDVLSRDGEQSSMLCELGSIGVRDYFRKIAEVALVAHHAQAQPPAASVTDEMVMRLKHALPLFCADVTMADARAALETALATQENHNG